MLTDDHGPRLYAYLEPFWTAQGMSETAWAGVHQLGGYLTKWRKGELAPSIGKLREIATKIDRPCLELLIACGYLTEAEAGQVLPPFPVPEPVTLEDAIARDPGLADEQRAALLLVLRGLRAGQPAVTATLPRSNRKR